MVNVEEYAYVEQDRPILEAELRGGEKFPELRGKVYVYVQPGGLYFQGDFTELPKNSTLAFHIHEGLLCENKGEKLLILPDVMADGEGSASMQVYLDRVTHNEIAGRPVVVHLRDAEGKDADSIACGLLRRVL